VCAREVLEAAVRADAIASVGAVHARVRLWVGMRKMFIGIANRERRWRLEFLGT